MAVYDVDTALPHLSIAIKKRLLTQSIFLPLSQTHACMNTCTHTCTLFYGYFKKQIIYILVIGDQLRHIPTWYHKVYFLAHYPNTHLWVFPPTFSQSKFLSLYSELLYQFSNIQASHSLHSLPPSFLYVSPTRSHTDLIVVDLHCCSFKLY